MAVNDINLDGFQEPGLYLQPPREDWISMTRSEIERRVQDMLHDPTAIPPETRAAAEYQPCDICPEKDTAEICHAIMTTLPFAKDIDRFASFQNVTAVYREPPCRPDQPGGLYVRMTSMQEALQYISMLSLLFYCEVGRKYYACFENVNPLMPYEALSRTVFSNIYLLCGGNNQRIQEHISQMNTELLLTATCQIKRLQLICQKDAFINAFIGTHTTAQMLMQALQDLCEKSEACTG